MGFGMKVSLGDLSKNPKASYDWNKIYPLFSIAFNIKITSKAVEMAFSFFLVTLSVKNVAI